MEVKNVLLKVVALVALLSFNLTTSAQVANPSSGNGSLLVAVWDGAKSVVVDLSRATQVGGSGPSGLSFSSGTLSGSSFDLSLYLSAAGVNLANAEFMVFAGDSSGVGATNGRGLLSTVAFGDSSTTDAYQVASIVANFNLYSLNELNGTCVGVVNCSSSLGSSAYWANFNWYSTVTWDAAGTVGGIAYELFRWVNQSGTTAATSLGSVSLSSNGILSFGTPSSPVPPLLPFIQSDSLVPGLEPSIGQRTVRLSPLSNGRVAMMWSRGYNNGCAGLFSSCTEQATIWHTLLDNVGLVFPPRRSSEALDNTVGFNVGSFIVTDSTPYNGGDGAVFALGHSSHNSLGGNFVRLDSNGAVVQVAGGLGAYEPNICSIGADVAVMSRYVDPVRFSVDWWSGGSIYGGSLPVGGYGYNYVGGEAGLACGTSTTLGGRFAVVLQKQPSSHIGLSLFSLSGGTTWSAIGGESRLSTTVGNALLGPRGGIAIGNDTGVVVVIDNDTDGRSNAFLVRFRITPSGIQYIDATPRVIFRSNAYEGVDAAVTFSAGVFYVSVLHSGRATAGVATNHAQAVSAYSLDFNSGLLNLVGRYEDQNYSGLAPYDFRDNTSIAASCDGNLYVSTALDDGSGRGQLRVFRNPVRTPFCVAPPIVTKSVTGQMGNNGWYIGDVTVSWNVDLRGGTALSSTGCGTSVVSADTTGTTLTCTITTTAGTASDSVTVRRDATPPTVVGTQSPSKNSAGWNNTSVAVSFTGLDATSGVVTCSASVVLAQQGSNLSSGNGTCTDAAGNSSTGGGVSGINIDFTPPVVSPTPSRQANAAGWHNAAVSVAFTATDSLSGIAVDGCDAPVVLTTDGVGQSASGACRDLAGNVASATLSGIKIDRTPPIAIATPSIQPNAANWFNSALTVSFAGSDGLAGSGIANCSAPIAVTSDVTGLRVTGGCTDVAGNISPSAIQVVNLDRIAPIVTLTAPAQGGTYFQGANLTAAYGCTDERSGVFSCVGSVANGQLVSTATLGLQGFAAAVTDAAGNSAITTVTFTVSAPVPAFSLAPASIAFGGQALNVSSAAQTVTLTSSGGAALPVTSVALTGTNANQFTLGNGCGASVASGTSCGISITFRPTTAGAKTAALTVVTTGGGTKTVALTGTGGSTAFTLTPTSLAFGNQAVGSKSVSRPVTLTNSGTVPLPMSTISFTGTGANQFGQTNNCGIQVAVGATCTISVVFAPTTTGAKTATLSVAVLGGAAARTVTLTGSGVAAVAALTLNPVSVGFATQPVGTVSTARAVALSNTGSSTVSIVSLGIGGTASGDYQQSSNCGTALVAGASCQLQVAFAPKSRGTKSASINVTTGTGATTSVALTGTAN